MIRIDGTWTTADNSHFPHEVHYLCGTGHIRRLRRVGLKHKQPTTAIICPWFGLGINPLPPHVVTSGSLLCAREIPVRPDLLHNPNEP